MTLTTELNTQRYTAPTCTLEVTGEVSPLSQLSDRPILKRLRFRLQILNADGSELLELRGMRSQLLELSGAVQRYLQSHLRQAPADPVTAEVVPSDRSIYLQPEGLTSQRLYLGHLAPRRGLDSVRLGTLQLADLAAVLGALEESVRILPGAALPRVRRRFSQRYAWIGTGAAVVLVAVGVSTFIPRLVQQSGTQQSAPITSEEGAASGDLNNGAGNGSGSDRASQAEELAQSKDQPSPQAATPAPTPSASAFADSAPATAQTPATPQMTPPATPAIPPVTSSNRPTPTTTMPQAPPPRDEAPAQTAPTRPSPTPGQITGDIAEAPPPAPAPQASSEPVPGGAAETNNDAASSGIAPPTAAASEAESSDTAESLAANDQAASRQAASRLITWLDAVALRFQQNWQPPADLRSALEYEVAIAADGTLTTLTPLNDLTRRTPIQLPDIGTVVADPPPDGNSQRLRLIFRPSGTVEAVEATE